MPMKRKSILMKTKDKNESKRKWSSSISQETCITNTWRPYNKPKRTKRWNRNF